MRSQQREETLKTKAESKKEYKVFNVGTVAEGYKKNLPVL